MTEISGEKEWGGGPMGDCCPACVRPLGRLGRDCRKKGECKCHEKKK